MKMLLLWLCFITAIYGVRRPPKNHPGLNRKAKQTIYDMPFARSAGSAFDEITKVNGLNKKFIEGDIVRSPRTLEFIAKMKAGDFSKSTYDAINRGQWPNGIVPYTIHSSIGRLARQGIYAAIADYKKYTCIEFVPYTAAAARSAAGYVQFFVGGGCYSMIGRQGGKQQISLGNGCHHKGTVIHEMMHALGFFHEQSRRDRGSHIYIYTQNIIPSTRYNFEMYRQGEASTLGEPYDKKSVMHYGNYAFSSNGRATIVSRTNRNERLGNTQLSPIDIRQLNKYYSCSTTTTNKCSDKVQGCESVKYWCRYDVVKKDCPKTCGVCGTTRTTKRPSVTCVDKHRHCPAWARDRRNQYCQRNDYVRLNCKKSCNKC